jgi:hypothetical protein
MDSNWAVVSAAAIGFASGPISAWVADILRYRRGDRADKARRERLLKILKLPAKRFRRLADLSKMIGADEEKTQQLLLEIGARHSLKRGSTKWVLISRSPYPDDAASEPDDSDDPENSN